MCKVCVAIKCVFSILGPIASTYRCEVTHIDLPVGFDVARAISPLPKKRETIFNYRHMATNFWIQRTRIATKLQNPRILEIHFTTFRHWKGTTEYHRTRDILYVQKLLGHRSVQSTMIYIDYEKACFGSPARDEFTVKVAPNTDEACKLIEVGFEYVTGDYMDGGKIFRKRK